MGYKATPWSERMFQLLEDGPRTREELIQSSIGLVPPGRAHRQAETNRIAIARRKGHKVSPRKPNDDTIRSGARHIIAMSLIHFIRSGRIEKRDDLFYLGRDRTFNAGPMQEWWANAKAEEKSRAIQQRTQTRNERIDLGVAIRRGLQRRKEEREHS